MTHATVSAGAEADTTRDRVADGEHEAPLVRELREMPPGRYVIIPANEPEDFDLTAEPVRGVEEALAKFERGKASVSCEESRR